MHILMAVLRWLQTYNLHTRPFFPLDARDWMDFVRVA